jgi:hypothetical protein
MKGLRSKKVATYEHEGYTYQTEGWAIFNEVWGMVDAGDISTNTGHRMLGRYFGYPECCIEEFIKHHKRGVVHDRFYCEDCMDRKLHLDM